MPVFVSVVIFAPVPTADFLPPMPTVFFFLASAWPVYGTTGFEAQEKNARQIALAQQ
jgi:hypothetical protein